VSGCEEEEKENLTMTDQFEVFNADGDGLGHRPVVGFDQLSAWN